MAADADRLLALAEAISDGKPADWAAAESQAGSDDERALVRELRLLADLADTHRSASEGDAVQDVPTLDVVRWGGLDVRERLGAGTYGVVYRAYDQRLAREVALKLLHSTEDLSGQAVEEGRLLARVRHPHVITVFGADRFDGRVGIWMELIRGGTLEALLRERGPFSAREAASMGAELCGALAAVHRAGLVHRDVKAQNVMREAGGRLVLMDFGAGQELMPGAQRGRVGTPLYMAPELFDGADASPRSDIYSLGVLLFHIVTGEYPVVGASATAVRDAHASGERRRLIDIRPDLPRPFVQVVDRAIARDPADRYATAGAMEEALTRAFNLHPPQTADTPSARRAEALRGSRRWITFAAVGAALAAVALAVIPSVRSRVGGVIFSPAVKTVVVLPLENLSGNAEDSYIVDGVTDLLTNRLATVPSVRVIARASIGAMGASDRNGPGARRRLRADYVIEGSVHQQANRLRVTARLLEASSGTLLFARTYEKPLSELYALQDEMTSEIARGIGARPARSPKGRGGSTSVDAQDEYLRGRYLLYTFNSANFLKARQHFDRAVAFDADYAAAHAALARTYGLLLDYDLDDPAVLGPLAIQEAHKAVEADPDLLEANVAEGDVQFRYAHNWAAAEAAYRRALAIAPYSSLVLTPYARFLCAAGRLDEALVQAKLGAVADPLSAEMLGTVAITYYYRREYDVARRWFEQMKAAAPASGPARFGLGRVSAAQQDYDAAVTEIKDALTLAGDNRSYQAELARVYALRGSVDLARQTLGGVLGTASGGRSLPYEGIGYAYAALGRRDEAFAWFHRALDNNFARLLFLQVDPRMDPIRDDPRYVALLQRLGLRP
jgi:TolB-like protein/Tfp pilus assembly protein PilF